MIEAFPLQWPVGYKRSITHTNSKFSQTVDKAQQFLRNELYRMGCKNIIVSTNVPIRKDGYLYSDMMGAIIPDLGVAVYFKYNNKEVVMCCDKYYRVWENIFALGKGVEALRGMDRWGVSEFIDRAFAGFKALPETVEQNWWQVLGISPDSDPETIKQAYRNMSKVHHPDAGGSAEMFDRVNKAYQQAFK